MFYVLIFITNHVIIHIGCMLKIINIINIVVFPLLSLHLVVKKYIMQLALHHRPMVEEFMPLKNTREKYLEVDNVVLDKTS